MSTHNTISIKEVPIEEVVKVGPSIVEFDRPCEKNYFENEYGDRKHLITAASADGVIVGYIVWYDRDGDGSLFCWEAGVNPDFRRMGILKQMMDYGFKRARESGYNKIKTKTKNFQREMISYLVKDGFWFTNVIPKENIRNSEVEFEKAL